MDTIISINALSKVYDNGFAALKNVNLDIERGEIIALLGPNGAGKTTLISTITGIVTPSSGEILVDGFDNVKQFRKARERIGLVPQELSIGAFEKVWDTVSFSRGLFGLKPDKAYIEGLLNDLSLLDKKDNQLRTLSGGMKRRVLIAKALAHNPQILFLDEPTAGVDVELRKDMWRIVARLREQGVTIILTTHYIEEAEEIADRVAVISDGEILLVEQKEELMQKMGKKQLIVETKSAATKIPDSLQGKDITVSDDGHTLTYSFDTQADATGISDVLSAVSSAGLGLKDVQTKQSSLEEIFVDLVSKKSRTNEQVSENGRANSQTQRENSV